jgi:hypothetical protein
MKQLFISLILFSFSWGSFSQDADMINKIKKEGTENSKVMDIAFHLTDISGPRLTSSPGFFRAANWAKDQMTIWGLSNAAIEPWGEFGRSWQQDYCYVAMTSPYYSPLIAYPKAWTTGTGKKGIKGEIILIKANDTTELAKYAGKLKGKIVMTWVNDALKPSFEGDANRFADSTLEKMAKAEPRPSGPNQGNFNRNQQGNPNNPQMNRFLMQRRINDMLNKEKPGLILSMNIRGTDGTVFVQQGGSAKDSLLAPPAVVLSSDDYLRLQRLVDAGQKVTIEADVKTTFFDKDKQGYNVVAEIPGTDPNLKDQVVMLGGHLDSWHGATGATDNAAGCAVMMEVVRILKSLGVQPRRTIRIALWSGEEQGLFGSRAYVKNHFTDSVARSKVSAYYNLDNGTGRIRGIYLQGNNEVRPLFEKWLEPFHDMGAKTVTINNTGGTDHLSFDAVGIPGFQFIQDAIEYDTRTHHTNMDTYDHLVPEDLKQAAIIVATFVYNTAQMDQMIPRKPVTTSQRGF